MHGSLRVNERFGGLVTEIVLGPPPGNIITAALIDELSRKIDTLANSSPANRHRKLIMFSGEGEHFSYGASIEEHRPHRIGEVLPRFHALVRRIVDCEVPTLAKVSGLCLGGGFEIALACGMLFAASDAQLGLPEIQLGVFPPAGSVLLPCKVGDSHACEIILAGQRHTAEECRRFGIINRIAERESLDQCVTDFIENHIVTQSASSLRIACSAARARVRHHVAAHLPGAERLYLDTLMSTKDAREGIEAFLEKRTPEWRDA